MVNPVSSSTIKHPFLCRSVSVPQIFAMHTHNYAPGFCSLPAAVAVVSDAGEEGGREVVV
jgi:hypothetical protein